MRLAPAVIAVAVAVVGAAAPAAAGECSLVGRPWLEARVRGSRGPARRAVDAHLGDTIDVFLVADASAGGRRVRLSDDGAGGHLGWRAAGCLPDVVAWRRVEPRRQHETTPAPNPDIPIYANAHFLGPDHGRWIGFDRIEYYETPFDVGERHATTIQVRDARALAPSPRPADLEPLGVMRLAATASYGARALATPDVHDAPDGQMAPTVLRYTFRRGDDFLGWLGTFFNVPYLFGSAGKGARSQAERYIGADCADILVAALRRSGHHVDYTSVDGLVEALPHVSGPVRPGDLYALDYVGVGELPRSWDHVVALVEDRGPDGRPDGKAGPEDLVADSGSAEGLKVAPLSEQGQVRVEVLRPR